MAGYWVGFWVDSRLLPRLTLSSEKGNAVNSLLGAPLLGLAGLLPF